MARRAARFSLLVAICLALLVAVLAGRRILSSREASRAHAPEPSQPPVAEDLLDDCAGPASADTGMSDRERILAWVARHGGLVSFDPIESFLEDTAYERAWHGDPRDTPTGDVVAIGLLTEDLDRALAELPRGATIPVLDLCNGRPTPDSVAHLTRIRGLVGLTIGQDITDAVVAVLGELRDLAYLLIEGDAITDTSLAHLGRLTALRHLGLIGVGIRGESGTSSLLPAALEVLYVTTRHGLDDSFITALPPLPNLRQLHLRETWITDAALPKIGTFGTLEELDLGNNRFSDGALGHLKDLRRLEDLDLDSSPITDEGLATIANLASLEELSLRSTAVKSLAGIERLAKLHSIDLASATVTDEALGRLVPLKRLEDLNLSDTKTTDRGLAFVGALRGLRRLNLTDTRVTNAGLAHLRGLGRLEDLDLTGTSVGDDGLRQLIDLVSLRRLELVETRVTADGLLALKALPNLRDVCTSWIDPDGAAQLAAAMPDCSFGQAKR